MLKHNINIAKESLDWMLQVDYLIKFKNGYKFIGQLTVVQVIILKLIAAYKL